MSLNNQTYPISAPPQVIEQMAPGRLFFSSTSATILHSSKTLQITVMNNWSTDYMFAYLIFWQRISVCLPTRLFDNSLTYLVTATLVRGVVGAPFLLKINTHFHMNACEDWVSVSAGNQVDYDTERPPNRCKIRISTFHIQDTDAPIWGENANSQGWRLRD